MSRHERDISRVTPIDRIKGIHETRDGRIVQSLGNFLGADARTSAIKLERMANGLDASAEKIRQGTKPRVVQVIDIAREVVGMGRKEGKDKKDLSKLGIEDVLLGVRKTKDTVYTTATAGKRASQRAEGVRVAQVAKGMHKSAAEKQKQSESLPVRAVYAVKNVLAKF